MKDASPRQPRLTRRQFLRTCVGAGALTASAWTPLSALGISNQLSVKTLPQAEPFGQPSLWQTLREQNDPSAQFLLRHGLAPLFGVPPAAKQWIASSTHPHLRTWSDRAYPTNLVKGVKLDALETEELANQMQGDMFGRWVSEDEFHSFSGAERCVEIEIDGEQLWVAPIAQIDGPCSLDRISFVQQPPWSPPFRLENLEVILQVDHAWRRYDAEDFFTRWAPFAANTVSSDGNNCSLPIGAQQHFALYLRSTADRFSGYERRYISALSGWFAALFSCYEPEEAQQIVAFTPQTMATYQATTAKVQQALREIGFIANDKLPDPTAFEWVARKVYGPEQCQTQARFVTLTNTTAFDLPLSPAAIPVGLRITIPKAHLAELDQMLLRFTYPDGYVITLPVRYLFGSFIEDPVNIAPPKERAHVYATLHTGLKEVGETLLLYANLPLVGLAALAFQTEAVKPLRFHLEYDTVPSALLPASLQGKKFVPYYAEIASNGHDHIVAPPVFAPGLAVGTYLFEADWQQRADPASPPPFTTPAGKKPSNWKFFYMEYNATLLRFSEEPSGPAKPLYAGSVLGWEDWVGSFYNGGDKDNAKPSRNMRKGNPLQGRFLAARYSGEKQEFEGGVCFFAPLQLAHQAFVLPQYGYNRVDPAPLINHCRLRTLTLCYLSEAEDLHWEVAELFKRLEIQANLPAIPLAHLTDLTVRQNLKRIAQKPPQLRTVADQVYIDRALLFYWYLAQDWANERHAQPTLHVTHALRQRIQDAYQLIFGV